MRVGGMRDGLRWCCNGLRICKVVPVVRDLLLRKESSRHRRGHCPKASKLARLNLRRVGNTNAALRYTLNRLRTRSCMSLIQTLTRLGG